jgi:hypothetical protein
MQRQIHRANLCRPRRRRSLVAQGLVRPKLVIEAKPLADTEASGVTLLDAAPAVSQSGRPQRPSISYLTPTTLEIPCTHHYGDWMADRVEEVRPFIPQRVVGLARSLQSHVKKLCYDGGRRSV